MDIFLFLHYVYVCIVYIGNIFFFRKNFDNKVICKQTKNMPYSSCINYVRKKV